MQDAKHWERECSSKLDEGLYRLHQPSSDTRVVGPVLDESQVGEDAKEVEETESAVRLTTAEGQIIRRIWDNQWHPGDAYAYIVRDTLFYWWLYPDSI